MAMLTGVESGDLYVTLEVLLGLSGFRKDRQRGKPRHWHVQVANIFHHNRA